MENIYHLFWPIWPSFLAIFQLFQMVRHRCRRSVHFVHGRHGGVGREVGPGPERTKPPTPTTEAKWWRRTHGEGGRTGKLCPKSENPNFTSKFGHQNALKIIFKFSGYFFYNWSLYSFFAFLKLYEDKIVSLKPSDLILEHISIRKPCVKNGFNNSTYSFSADQLVFFPVKGPSFVNIIGTCRWSDCEWSGHKRRWSAAAECQRQQPHACTLALDAHARAQMADPVGEHARAVQARSGSNGSWSEKLEILGGPRKIKKNIPTIFEFHMTWKFGAVNGEVSRII